MPIDLDAYLRAIAATPVEAKTEHSDRSALERLLQQAADDGAPGGRVQHEPRRDKTGHGSPDFKVTRGGRIVGYVEVKTIDENLSKVLRSDQIKKYRSLSDNIVLTDYLEFCWIRSDGSVTRERLAHFEDLSARKLRLKPDRVEAIGLLLRGFLSAAPQRVARAQDLALALASRAAMLRDFLTVELVRQSKEHQEGRLHALHDVFRRQVFHELKLAEFADAFAQMLAYGLFLARLNAGAAEVVTLQNVRGFIPGSFNLIRELVRFLEEMDEPEYADVRWVVHEVLSIVNGLDLVAIYEDLSFRTRRAASRKVRAKDEDEHRLFERDPFIYFYEDFLEAYDPAMRKGRGVYYTPPPVVNFIVRAIDDVLKDTFGIRDGLADHRRVTVLDFACGTGTFMLEVFQRVFDNIGGADAGKADAVVREHLLENVFGFEYLIAPYTIAHLKLSQYLRERGHSLGKNDRLQVYLTNTLEPIEPQPNFFLPALAAEAEAAQRIKDKPILVITGNPPYAGHSKNKGTWITNAIATYRKDFPELAKPAQGKWLQDDYVKFIRFAQMKMDAVAEGIVGIITNHSWLDNPTFKGMRKSLTETFDQIYILDLHGNTKKKERAPDGSKDENVFDIEQGVAVSLLVKRPEAEKGVWHAALWGERIGKYRAAASATIESVDWTLLKPTADEWLFTPRDSVLAETYDAFWPVPAIFSRLGDPAPGFVTTQDDFAISYTKAEAKTKVLKFLACANEADARAMFQLCGQSQWSYGRAVRELRTIDVAHSAQEVSYRPFDSRWTVWNRNVNVHRRTRVNNHLLHRNVALVVTKNAGAIGASRFDGISVSENPVDFNFFRRGGEYIFPIRISDYLVGSDRMQFYENISFEFRSELDSRYSSFYSVEEIAGFAYAILHAPTYRTRYAEFLRSDFPRIPVPDAAEDFEALSELGWALVQAHLLRELPRPGLAGFHGRGDRTVEAVRYSPAEQAIAINKTQSFAPIPPAVWEFHIGGYQVLDKYLKARKGRVLSLDEIDHVGAVADSLAFTIEQMARIDAAYRAAFPDGG